MTTLMGRQDASGGPRFADVMAAEWTKLRSVRSTPWSFAAMVALGVGFCVLATSLYTHNWAHLSAADRLDMRHDTIGLILQPGALYAQIAVCVLGALLMAGEYSTGMIDSSMLAVPRRAPVLLAKAAVFAIVTFVVTEIVALASFAIGSSVVRAHAPITLGQQHALRAIIGDGLVMALIGVFALSIGTIVRHTAAAITVILGLVLLVPLGVGFLPGTVGDAVSTYVPGGHAAQAILSSGYDSGSRDSVNLIGAWAGLAVTAGWSALTLAIAIVSPRRRDV